jgi:hemerythrin-like domain-containing protein
MTPTETLKHEHEVILLVLEAARREVQSIEKTGKVRAATVEKMVDFFREFADHCHHAKEEKLLFPAMQRRGMPAQSGPIGVMLHEHDQGRGRIAAIAGALPEAAKNQATAAQSVKENLSAYADLLEAHIDKENTILFVMADQLLSPQDQQSLAAAFDKVEAEEIGPGTHEKYHQLAHELQSS